MGSCKDCKNRFVDIKTGTNCHSTCEDYLNRYNKNRQIGETKGKEAKLHQASPGLKRNLRRQMQLRRRGM